MKRQMFITLLAVALLACLGGYGAVSQAYAEEPTPELQWVRTYDSGVGDTAWDIAVDPEKSVIAAGMNDNPYNYYDMRIAKFTGNGDPTWNLGLDNGWLDLIRGVATDADGNIYVVGFTGSYPSDLSRNSRIVKLSPNGTVLWDKTFYITTSSGRKATFAYDIAFSGTAIYVAGAVTRFMTPGATCEAFIAKFNSADGQTIWQKAIPMAYEKFAATVALDGAGNVLVGGVSTDWTETPNSRRFLVAKFDPSGNQIFAKTYGDGVSPAGDGGVRAIAADEYDNILMAGEWVTPGGNGILYVKTDANGNQPVAVFTPGILGENVGGGWSYSSTGPGVDPWLDSAGMGKGMVDAKGYFIVSGTSGNPSTGLTKMAAVMLDPEGRPIWTVEVAGAGHLTGASVVVDAEGYIYLAGSGGYTDPNNSDMVVAKYRAYIPVAIDIKPGEEPNSINLGSAGKVPVAIFSTDTFDATQVDPLTVTLAGAQVALKGKGTPMAAVADVNADGRLDLIVHVDTTALQLTAGDMEAVLEGKTYAGLCIRGTDTVRIVP